VLSRCFTTRGRRFGGITRGGASLFIADIGNFAIRKVVIATGEVTPLAWKGGISGYEDGTGMGARFENSRPDPHAGYCEAWGGQVESKC
jgi:hypothetical protein